MPFLRVVLALIFVAVLTYTAVTISHHGLNLMPIFFGDMAQMKWPGQFNFDFMCLLALSGLWVSWRHRFSGVGLVLGLAAFLGGALFLSAYLLVESRRAQGDVARLLLGSARLG